MDKLVIVTHKGHYFGAIKARQILIAAKQLGLKSICVSNNTKWTKRFSDYCVETEQWNDPKYLIKLIDSIPGKLIFTATGNDWGVPTIGILNEHYKLDAFKSDAAKIVSDKYLLHLEGVKRGLDPLKSLYIKSESDFNNDIFENTPIFVKPTHSTGSFSDREWGYTNYKSLKEFHYFLKENNHLDQFLEDQNDPNRAYGGFYISEFLDNSFMPDIYFNIMKDSIVRWFSTTAELHDFEGSFKPVTTKGPIVFDSQLNKKIDTYLDIFNDLKFYNTFGNLQFLSLNENLYPLDFNGRISNIWTHIYQLICPDFFTESIESFLTNTTPNFNYNFSHFVRSPYQIQSGTIKEIQIPELNKEQSVICFPDKLEVGKTIRDNMTSVGTDPQIFALGNSFNECYDIIDQQINNTIVSYI